MSGPGPLERGGRAGDPGAREAALRRRCSRRARGQTRGRTAHPRALRSPALAASLYASGTERSRSNSFGDRPGGGSGGGGARRARALVSHSEGANHTLLRFSAGDVVEVLVSEARNGWLYGKLEGSSA